jgi:hypothetical protein
MCMLAVLHATEDSRELSVAVVKKIYLLLEIRGYEVAHCITGDFIYTRTV